VPDTQTTPFFFEMPAGYTTIKSHRNEPLQGEPHATSQIAYAQVFREETGRTVGLLRVHRNRLSVIAKVESR